MFKLGHFAKDCHHQKGYKKKEVNLVENNEDMVAMLTEILMVSNDEGWWVDSGATCHVTPHKSVFKTYEAINGEKAMFMGNSSTSTIMGNGTMQLPLTSGKV